MLGAALFGRLLALPGVRPVRETPRELTVTIAAEAPRPVAELLGCRAPARTVATLEAVARQAALVASRRAARPAA